MVEYRRNKLDSQHAVYFLTICTRDKQSLFKTNLDLNIVKSAMDYVIDRFKLEIPVWVILPNHIHWLINPVNTDYSKVVYAFKVRVFNRLKPIYKLPAGISIWQPRFWEHTVRDDNELAIFTDYIHFNPVKHGFVDSPEMWKYSSIGMYIKKGFYDVDWTERKNELEGMVEYD